MAEPPLAVFDFDGTITTRDTMLPFLHRVAGTQATAVGLIESLPNLARAPFGDAHAHTAKEAVLRRTLGGRSVGDIEDQLPEFTRFVHGRLLREMVMARIRFHAARGHELVVASAGLKVYVSAVGSALGFDATIATVLAQEDGRYTGRIEGRNVKGAEKVRLLQRFVGESQRPVLAYGNSSGDMAMLEWADKGYLVGRRGIRSVG